ncbi:MAG TPA: NAD(P)-dependent oxidoreductase [Steroidobacteraceae bacterium]|nr:NAD(P)-dependent oxidoreductase [Steroidobacteraceae bacterium]
MSRYLITGGAGFLGINLCRYLLQRGHAVRSIDIAPFNYPERSRVEVIDGDVRDPAAVARAVEGADTIVHCAAALPLAAPGEIMSTAVSGTQTLLKAAATGHLGRFVFISSTAVYGIPDHHPVQEDDRLDGVGPYGRSKILAEALCLQARASGLPTTILRPKSFVGPERLGVFELLYSWAFEGRSFPVLGRGDNRYQLLDVSDLCNAIELCATCEPALANDIFNVGAARFGTMREIVQTVLDRAGHGRQAVTLPAAPAVLLLRIFETLRLSPLYGWIYRTATCESFVSIDRITQRLGFRPRYSNGDALIRNYDWYVDHRPEFESQHGITHRVPWRKGVLGLAKHVF